MFPIAVMGVWAAVGCGGMAAWMLWSSKGGKLQERERLLDHIAWTGASKCSTWGAAAD
jgi:hypothetical protein